MSKKNIILILLLINFIPTLLFSQRDANKAISKYDRILQDVFCLQNSGLSADVSNFSMKRDVGNFSFKNGKFYLLSPIDSVDRALLFIGTGDFNFIPPTMIEQAQLNRYYKSTNFKQNFTTLFIICNDTTVSSLKRQLNFSADKIQFDTKGVVSDIVEYYSDKEETSIRTSFMKSFLDNNQDDFFHAFFYKEKSEPFAFEILPNDFEPVRFLRKAETSQFYSKMEVICQFPEYNSNSRITNLIHVTDYKINTQILKGSILTDKLDYTAVCDMSIIIKKSGQRWLYFYINSEIEVDSVKTIEGNNLLFSKPKDSPVLFIECERKYVTEDSLKIKVFYKSNRFIKRNVNGWIVLNDEADWFPMYSSKNYAMFKLTFTYPKKMDLVSIGKKTNETVFKGYKTSTWITEKPVGFASFNLGGFKKVEKAEKNLPKIIVLKTEKSFLAQRRGMEYEIADDILNCVKFYTYILGECPIDKLYVSESPYLHGVAFPGLIHLSTITYQMYTYKGYDEVFRAHETAHQWWGLGVDAETYHDYWLMEGFSNYFGLWYMQMAIKDNEKFFDILNEWRDDILNNRKYLLSDGMEAGPIWLGYRTNSSSTRGDYNLIIYKKGGWVLHMLRSMLINLNTMNEDIFMSMLKDFYKSYEGKKASTEDFKSVLEKHLNQNMDWFFNQWIYGTEIPEYTYSHKSVKLSNGKYKIHFRVRTEGVNNDFIMPVPIEFNFEGNSKARISRKIKGSFTEFSIILPLKPIDIKFNLFDSVLAKVKQENWKDY